MARTGRPPGSTRNREAILAAAAHQFSELGYDRTSMRAVAAEAGVDQALIAHYFGSKQQLFIAATEFPLDPAKLLPEILGGDRNTIGERLARAQLTRLEAPGARRRLTGLVRAASSEPQAARMLREFLTRQIVAPVAEALGSDQPELRASLVGSQIIGLLMTRYIVELEPLASLPAERVADLIAPTLQRYLTHPLPPTD
jgi:AcrR family transcriptional regulator